MPPKRILDKLREGAFIVAHPLVLTKDLRIDFTRQKALTRYYIAAGADGIAIGVHTTQFAVHDDFENMYKPLLESTMECLLECEKAVGREVIKVAGIVGDTAQALKEARLAWSLGYHAGLVSLHKLRGYPEERILEHIKAVSKEIPVFGFYLQPAVGGIKLGYRFWRRLAEEVENLVAIKIAPFNRYYTLEVVRAIAEAGRDDVALYTGNDDNIVADLLTTFTFRDERGNVHELEIVGGLLGHWAFWTRRSVEIYRFIRKVKRGKNDIPRELLTLGTHITDVNKAVFDVDNNFRGSIAGVLEMLRRSGLLEEVRVLNPEEGLSPGQIDEIDRVYRMYPHLRDDEFTSKYINEWLEGKCAGYETLRDLTVEDIRSMVHYRH